MLDFEPPLIGCVISNRNFSFNLLKSTGECVLAIPSVNLAAIVTGVGNTTGREIDKFRKFGLTMMPAKTVAAPLIAECFANLECRVTDSVLVNKYNFFILEVTKAWTNPAVRHPRTIHHLGYGNFMVAGRKIRIVSAKR